MALAQEDIAVIQDLITKSLSDSLKSGLANVRYELELRERIVRVEEELRHQRELMLEGFKQMDKRFEQIDKRFEQADKRFESLAKRIDRFMVWSFTTTLTVGGLVVAAIRFLP